MKDKLDLFLRRKEEAPYILEKSFLLVQKIENQITYRYAYIIARFPPASYCRYLFNSALIRKNEGYNFRIDTSLSLVLLLRMEIGPRNKQAERQEDVRP